jgi:hypothetical protein
MKLTLSPSRIYLLWTALFVLFCLLIPVLSHGHNGGEQRGLVLLGYGLNYFVEGLFILSITTSFFYKEWFKRKWYINILIMFITGGILLTVVITNGGVSSLF